MTTAQSDETVAAKVAQIGPGPLRKFLATAYGVAGYVLALGTFMYAIGFVGDFLVPKTIDSGTPGPFWPAVLVNVALLSVFAVQHSVMARPAFKRWWIKVIPHSIERNTYVFATNFAMILMFWQWQPLAGVVWSVELPALQYALYAACGLGWLTVLCSTFMLNHFDLFGLRQALLNLKGRAHAPLEFRTPLLYTFVRHPIQMGFVIAFWATPHMTVGHLLFTVMTTGYIMVALQLEERDLIAQYGDRYRTYMKQVRMLLPIRRQGS